MRQSGDRGGLTLLAVALLAGVVFSLPTFRGQALALDEHVSYFSAGAESWGELWRRTRDVQVTPPLSHLLERASLSLFGHHESAFRLPSVLASLVSIVLAFLLGRRLTDAWGGGLTAGLIAAHPECLDSVRFARCYGLTLALATASVWALVRWWQSPPRVLNLLLWTIISAASFSTHYLTAPLIAAESLALLVAAALSGPGERGMRLRRSFVGVILVGLSTVPYLTPVMRLAAWGPYLTFRSSSFSFLDAVGFRWSGPVLAALILAAIWVRAVPASRDRSPSTTVAVGRISVLWWIALLWLLPLGALVIGAATNPELAQARYRLPLAAVNAALLAGCLRRWTSRSIGLLLTVATLIAGGLLNDVSPFRAARLGQPADESWRQAGLELRSRIGRPDLLLFTQGALLEGLMVPAFPEDATFQKYLSCRLGKFYTGRETGLPLPFFWMGAEELTASYRTRLKSAAIREVIVAVATDTDLARDSVSGLTPLLLEAGFVVDQDESRPGMAVTRYVRR